MTGPTSGGEALVAALVAHGVDTVFGIPGTHNLEIYRHLLAHGVRHVGTRHEQGAGYAADGYARTTGRVGVALVTTGPALLNAVAAIGQAYSDSVPVLVVSPGLPLRHPAAGNGLLHETKDQQGAMRAVAAASLRPTSVEDIPVAVAQAFAIMTHGRPRPVHLEVPLDVLLETTDGPATGPAGACHRLAPTAPAGVVTEAAAWLDDAAFPVILAGGGANRAAAELRAVAERLGAPVVTTTNGKGVLPEDHPLALGAGIHLPVVRDLVTEADVVLAVGTELAPADLWNGPLPLAGRLVRIDIDPVAMVTNALPDLGLVGDSARVLADLLVALGGEPARRDPIDLLGWRERKRADAEREGATWLPLVRALSAALPRDVVLGTDNAMFCYYGMLANLPVHEPSSYLFPTGYGTLGYGLPAAIGAKVGNPDRPVVAVLGDGGLMFTVAELATAAELGLTLPVVVVDNRGYGEIRHEMTGRGDPVHAVTFEAPDFAALGRSLGCLGTTVDDPVDLTAAVRVGLLADRPTVIHVRHHERAAPAGGGEHA
ncbi:acetolactate synthase [Humibacillus sp. DSM 29435]|nr:acetolactate synthase [Humibacillus sp. DSM 29435]